MFGIITSGTLSGHQLLDLTIGCAAEGDIRLAQSSDYSYLDGRVEVCRNNSWGTVCEYGWSSTDAIVACRQLGFNPHGNAIIDWL